MPTDGQSRRLALAISGLGHDQPGSTPTLFVYGSLLVDAVIATLIDRIPEYEVTAAPGYRVAHLPGKPYPGLVRDDRGLSAEEWAMLDAWENPVYEVQALAYVWTLDLLRGAPLWTTASMTTSILEDYLETTRVWREEYEEQTKRLR
ncbi:hypothetical protein VPNG_02803 [Cytospora leucostoma]|uniref:Gamma-glutamylcyclotransferase AIG2-like domain-containing protein n=1 Tax=Cytospora leucostoma TaxID=1230097 RepID=A0A423XJE5_9PEZI|nr:hypothetical protein VPNG_02803 [Cytospora leucostoma]